MNNPYKQINTISDLLKILSEFSNNTEVQINNNCIDLYDQQTQRYTRIQGTLISNYIFDSQPIQGMGDYFKKRAHIRSQKQKLLLNGFVHVANYNGNNIAMMNLSSDIPEDFINMLKSYNIDIEKIEWVIGDNYTHTMLFVNEQSLKLIDTKILIDMVANHPNKALEPLSYWLTS